MNWLLCFIFGHKASDVIEERQHFTQGGQHIRKEYRCTCVRCGKVSKPMRWKFYPDVPPGWTEED